MLKGLTTQRDQGERTECSVRAACVLLKREHDSDDRRYNGKVKGAQLKLAATKSKARATLIFPLTV